MAELVLPAAPAWDRRRFLRAALGGAAVALSPIPSLAGAADAEAFWSQPRNLVLHRVSTGERVQATYWQDGNWNLEGYVRLCEVLRDVKESSAVQMDRTLLDMLFGMQQWLRQHGYNKPLFVLSGYRTLATNQSLGEKAARNSMHLYGRAADITVPDVPPATIAAMAQYFKAGVGLYRKQNFTHIDTGNERFWRG